MDSAAGRRFGPYEILALVGAGGMGEVYRARDTRLGREVALKVLPPAFASDPDRLRRFEIEARTASLLSHPNVVALYDFGTDRDQPFIVSELLEGATLRERMKEEPLPARRVVDYALQIASGLAAAHEKGIVHRDLKPENLFVTRDRRVKILDLGLAKLTEGHGGAGDMATHATDTAPGVVLGTVGYMAPEQVRGEAADERSDIFAFGAILYEMLAGRPAFRADSAIETMTAVLREEPPELPPERVAPPALDRIARRCLEKRADDRFQSARDVGFALEAVSASGSAPLVTTPGGSRRRYVSRALAALALLSAGIVLGWFARPRDTSGGMASGWRAVRLVSTPAQEFGAAISPDGKWVAYLSDARGPVDIWVRFIAGGESVNLTAAVPLTVQARSDIGGLEISPDGTRIAFDAGPPDATASQFDSWTLAAPLGGTPRRLVRGGRGLRWSPDGRRITYIIAGSSGGDAIVVADASGENPREILPRSGGLHRHWLAWSAEGRHIYFIQSIAAGNLEPAEIYRVPADGGAAEPVVRSSRRAVYPVPAADGLLYAANSGGPELNLWWAPTRGVPERLTTGVGEYAEPRLAPSGRRMVCTYIERRQSLARLTVPAGDSAGAFVSLPDSFNGDTDPAASAAGDRLVFSSSRAGDRNLWIAQMDGARAQPLTSGPALDERPAWSPDGSQVAFVSDRGGRRGIWVVSADGGAPRHVVDAQVLDALSWSPDGRRVLYSAPGGDVIALWTVTLADRSVARVPTPGPAHAPAWSPAGDVIAYLQPPLRGAGTRVAFVDPQGRPLLSEASSKSPHLGNGSLAWSADGKRLAAISSPGGLRAVVWIVTPSAAQPFRKLAELPTLIWLRGAAWTRDQSAIIVGNQEQSSDIALFERTGS